MQQNYLIWNGIKYKCDSWIRELDEVSLRMEKEHNKLLLKSLFVYGVSLFETALNDIFKEVCRGIPGKIPTKNVTLDKEQIFKNNEDAGDLLIDNAIHEMGYKSLDQYLITFTNTLDIDDKSILKIDELIEIKEVRNLIIHNASIVGRTYYQKCKGVKIDEKYLNNTYPFSDDYANESIKLCSDQLQKITDALNAKYSSFTKIKAMKEIWNDLFHSPKLQFDDYWEYDEDGNILGFKKDDIDIMFSAVYSHTEAILMAMIMQHYWGSLKGMESIDIDLFNLELMYGERREKFLGLQKIFERYPGLFRQHITWRVTNNPVF